MRKLIIQFVLIAAPIFCIAQQDAMFTHYMYNTQAVNAAYAGSRDALTITGLHRSMWVGFDGAPLTQTIGIHSPVGDKFGLGLSFVNDKIGPANSTDVSFDLAYRLPINKKFKLSFGIKPSLNIRSVDLASLELESQNDQAFAQSISNQLSGNVGAGLYLHSNRFYTGISSPGLLQNALYKSNDLASIGTYQRHFFFIIGGMIKLSDNVDFKPTSLVKMTERSPLELDLTASFVFNEKFWAGVMGRTGDAVGLLLGYQISEQLGIGYSFDWSFANSTLKYNAGSHEIMIRYDFIWHNEKQIISPRYF